MKRKYRLNPNSIWKKSFGNDSFAATFPLSHQFVLSFLLIILVYFSPLSNFFLFLFSPSTSFFLFPPSTFLFLFSPFPQLFPYLLVYPLKLRTSYLFWFYVIVKESSSSLRNLQCCHLSLKLFRKILGQSLFQEPSRLNLLFLEFVCSNMHKWQWILPQSFTISLASFYNR